VVADKTVKSTEWPITCTDHLMFLIGVRPSAVKRALHHRCVSAVWQLCPGLLAQPPINPELTSLLDTSAARRGPCRSVARCSLRHARSATASVKTLHRAPCTAGWWFHTNWYYDYCNSLIVYCM